MTSMSGFKELAAALEELPKTTARNTLKRTLLKAAAPVGDAAKDAAPDDTGKLEQSIIVGTKLTRSQKRDNRDSKRFSEVYIGTALGRGMFTEFGTFKDVPQMWFSRAWGQTQGLALHIISTTLGVEIEKSAARLAKKQAKLAEV